MVRLTVPEQRVLLNLVTPGYYARLSLVAFSTEGSSSLNININYTDGTSERAMTNAPLADWYVGTANVVVNRPRPYWPRYPGAVQCRWRWHLAEILFARFYYEL